MTIVASFLMRAVIGAIFVLVNIISIYLLLRGHNLPGGGFIGGLMTGLSFVLLGMARGWAELQRELPLPPLRMATFGVTLAIVSGSVSMIVGEPFITHYYYHLKNVPLLGELHIGSPLIFDIGVFLLVSCITVKLVIVLARSTSGMTALTPGETLYYASVLEEPIEDNLHAHVDDEDGEEEAHGA